MTGRVGMGVVQGEWVRSEQNKTQENRTDQIRSDHTSLMLLLQLLHPPLPRVGSRGWNPARDPKAPQRHPKGTPRRTQGHPPLPSAAFVLWTRCEHNSNNNNNNNDDDNNNNNNNNNNLTVVGACGSISRSGIGGGCSGTDRPDDDDERRTAPLIIPLSL